MKRRWFKIAFTLAAGAAAPLVSSDDKLVSSVASAVVALGALYSRRPQDYEPSGHEPMPQYPLGHGKPPARPSPQDPPKH
jgi:hypothetical protein